MLEVYLILGIMGLLYAKSNKPQENYLDYVNVNYEVEKEKEAEVVTEKKNVFPVKELKPEPKVYGLSGEEINPETFLTRDDGRQIQAYTTKGVKDFGDNKDVRYLKGKVMTINPLINISIILLKDMILSLIPKCKIDKDRKVTSRISGK